MKYFILKNPKTKRTHKALNRALTFCGIRTGFEYEEVHNRRITCKLCRKMK